MRVLLALALVCACSQSHSYLMLDDGGTALVCGPGLGGCPSGQFCDFPDDLCGDGEPGVCVVDMHACSDISAPVCVCDGSRASNACYASHDVDARGGCESE